MKKTLTLLICSIFLISACSKDDEPTPTPVNSSDQLPPATQTGEVMLACTVNGVPYITKGYGQVASHYQVVNFGYEFIVRGINRTDLMYTIELFNRDSAPIQEGKVYVLNGNSPGYGGGGYVMNGVNELIHSTTTDSYTGEMTITRFDIQNEVVSGTFWFDIEDPWTGKIIEVRNGRFDTRFLQ